MKLPRLVVCFAICSLVSLPAFAGRGSCSAEGTQNRCSISCRYWLGEVPTCGCDDNGWAYCRCVAKYTTSTGRELILWVRDNYQPVRPLHVALLEGFGTPGQVAAAALEGALNATESQDFVAYDSYVLQYNSAVNLLTPTQRQAVDELLATVE